MLNMLNKIPTSAEWLALSDLGMAAFVFGMLILFFGILFLEWNDLMDETIKPIINFFKPKKLK